MAAITAQAVNELRKRTGLGLIVMESAPAVPAIDSTAVVSLPPSPSETVNVTSAAPSAGRANAIATASWPVVGLPSSSSIVNGYGDPPTVTLQA